jgi:sugar lactone lactonase YvrE
MNRLVISAMLLVGAVASTLAAEIEVINDKAAFPEGPVVVDGKLYYTEYGGNTLLVWDNGKTTKLWEQAGCGPSAVIPLGDDFAVTCYDGGAIARVSKEGKTVATYDKAGDGSPLVGPNDFSSDGKGGLYFTASGPWEAGPIVGKVFHLDADGTIREVANDLHYPNGIVLSKDGSRLFVNESEAARVISFAVGGDGALSDRRLFARLGVVDEASGIGAYPDGIKLGPDGNFYIGQYSKGRIVVVDGEGKFVKAIDVPSATAPNLAFSEDGESAFVTAVDDTANAPYWGKVYKVPLD